MSGFHSSPYYGRRVDAAKARKGWLSNDEFYKLANQEYADYLAAARLPHLEQQPFRRRSSGGGAIRFFPILLPLLLPGLIALATRLLWHFFDIPAFMASIYPNH